MNPYLEQLVTYNVLKIWKPKKKVYLFSLKHFNIKTNHKFSMANFSHFEASPYSEWMDCSSFADENIWTGTPHGSNWNESMVL